MKIYAESITDNGKYELRHNTTDISNRVYGNWEVVHHWLDGVTTQVKYFKTKKEAQKYYKEHTI